MGCTTAKTVISPNENARLLRDQPIDIAPTASLEIQRETGIGGAEAGFVKH